MNVNLTDRMIELWGHRQVLRNAGYRVVGPPVLLPDEEYPGVFQVWWPATEESGDEPQFMHVTPDGVVVWVDLVLPEHYRDEEPT